MDQSKAWDELDQAWRDLRSALGAEMRANEALDYEYGTPSATLEPMDNAVEHAMVMQAERMMREQNLRNVIARMTGTDFE
jgi:hypothetical protein